MKLLAGLIITASFVLPLVLLAHSAGPPPGAAGPPGDLSCGAMLCHLNSGGGKGSVSAQFPQGLTYTPGRKQHTVIALQDPAQQRWGFQTTVRPKDAPRSRMAETFASTDANTQVELF